MWFLLSGKQEGVFLGRRKRGKSIKLSGTQRSMREEGFGGRGNKNHSCISREYNIIKKEKI